VAERPQAVSVDAYGSGGFRLSGTRFEGSAFIRASVILPWRAEVLDAPAIDHLIQLVGEHRAEADFLLIGLGVKQVLPPPALRAATRQWGLGLEFMSTEAASRMHNVLTSEGRHLITALLAV
jgi:uncharacterized protein